MKRILILFILFAGLTGAFFGGVFDRTPEILVDSDSVIVFTNKRPDSGDKDVLLCVPAAYSTDDGEIIGRYSFGKKRRGTSERRFATVYLDKGTYFQQHPLLRNGRGRRFTDPKRRYRRALCRSGKRYRIVHSSRPVTLTAFAASLTEYDEAWNLDMGTYSYGWYRDDWGVHHLGLSTVWNRGKQTNWIVVRRK